MKKKIVIGIFTALILLTVVSFFVLIISSYNQDLENDDPLEALGAAILVFLGGCVVFYECDLFYTVYYFFVKPKTVLKSVLHILSHLSLVLLGVFLLMPSIMFFLPGSVNINSELARVVLFLIYVILRSASILVSIEDPAQIVEQISDAGTDDTR
jgi:hypothetical protein